ncbi:unnamed protein product, partial [Prorocentrum cordatum]
MPADRRPVGDLGALARRAARRGRSAAVEAAARRAAQNYDTKGGTKHGSKNDEFATRYGTKRGTCDKYRRYDAKNDKYGDEHSEQVGRKDASAFKTFRYRQQYQFFQYKYFAIEVTPLLHLRHLLQARQLYPISIAACTPKLPRATLASRATTGGRAATASGATPTSRQWSPTAWQPAASIWIPGTANRSCPR